VKSAKKPFNNSASVCICKVGVVPRFRKKNDAWVEMIEKTQGFAPLLEFSCSSRADASLPAAVFARILRQAQDFNTRHRVTGELRYHDGAFFQTLEAEAPILLPLAARILGDSRHCNIRIEAFGTIACRRYRDWTAIGLESPLRAQLQEAPVAANVALCDPFGERRQRRPRAHASPAKLLRF
jgi:hypothetical protein